MKVKLWAQIDDCEVAFVFTWDEFEDAWVCKMDDDFMKELGPVPYEKEEQ